MYRLTVGMAGYIAMFAIAGTAVFITPDKAGILSVTVGLLEKTVKNIQKHIWLPVPDPGPEVSVLLVGAAGNGRSALGNNIVGRNVFESRMSATMVTRSSLKIRTEIGSRKLVVVDTPGLLGHHDMIETEDVIESLKSSLNLSPEGYSAFVIVMDMANRITKEQIDAIKILEIVFGETFFKHAIFVFTHKDLFEKSVDHGSEITDEYTSFIDNQPDNMTEFLERADQRVLFVNNLETRRLANREFHIDLIHMIDNWRGRRYRKGQFDDAQGILRKEIREKLEREQREQHEKEDAIWKEAMANCRCPQERQSRHTFNLNLKFPGSDYVMMAVNYLFSGIQSLLGWISPAGLIGP